MYDWCAVLWRPDVEDRKELKQFILTIKEMLGSSPQKRDVTVSGNEPYREFKGLPIKPKAGRGCNEIGLCAAKCPVGEYTLYYSVHCSRSYDKMKSKIN